MAKANSGIVQVGNVVVIRGVTMIDVGRVTEVGPDDRWVRLEDAAWIADTGRFGAFLASGTYSECEPYPAGCVVLLGSACEIAPWPHALPRTAK